MIARRVLAALLGAGVLAAAAAGATSCQRRGGEPGATGAAPAAMERGQQGYYAYCAMCHGDQGAGDGPVAGSLAREAGTVVARLNDPARLDALGRAGIRRVIVEGGGHTKRSNLMPAWGENLEPALVDAIADYVLSLPSLKPETPPATVLKYLEAPAGSPEDGRRLYVYYCSGCHGPEGKGDGFNAEALRLQHNVWPRDLTDTRYFADKDDQDLYTTVALGGGHAGRSGFMPAWTHKLTPEQIKDLVSYVRVISGTPSRP